MKNIIFNLIKHNCIYHAKDHSILSSNNRHQEWNIDLKTIILNGNFLDYISTQISDYIKSPSTIQIAGVETSAIPLLSAVALEMEARATPVNACIIRNERKRYGLGRRIEGTLNAGDVLLIDDIFNSGDTLEKARVVLESAGRTVREVFVIIDYRSSKGMYWRKRHGIKVTSLFTLADFDLSLKDQTATPKRQWILRWQFSADGASPFHVVPKSTPLLIDGCLYFGSDSGTFWCLRASDGRPLWQYKVSGGHRKGIWSSPAYSQGRIYFGAYSGAIFCLDALTGQELWSNPVCDWIGSSPCLIERHSLLVIGLEYERQRAQGGMAAFDLANGEKLWERPMLRYQHGSATYSPECDLVICGNSDHFILAQSPATGEAVWEFPTMRSLKYPPAIDHERKLVVAASFDGFIYIVRLETGELVEKFKTDDICYTTPLISHGRVFCGSGDKKLYVIDLDRMNLVDKLDCCSRVYSSPRINGDVIGFGSNSGVYREINPLTLKLETYLQLPDAITNAVSVSADGKMIYVPTYMNEIYAFERVV